EPAPRRRGSRLPDQGRGRGGSPGVPRLRRVAPPSAGRQRRGARDQPPRGVPPRGRGGTVSVGLLRPATTILVLPPQEVGFEVFLVRRHRRMAFLPHAWVFPGGRVEDADALVGHGAVRGGERAISHLGLDPRQGLAMLVAGVRETFEE